MKKLKLALISSMFMGLVGCSGGVDITASSTAEEIYNASCASCHGGGLKGWMTGAPEVGDVETWKPLQAKGVEAMTLFSIKGVNKMPARGGCKTCTDEQIKATVEYMAENSK
ncbi:c-type cytochrome [Litoribacillus peritrichatus]|uniref:Cytochrome c domain-containing protein n=1 Tax=Litoribacillus peritrichatus TaxID=718191 RepID=A0ABP7N0G0_9GAMM